jgi:hypothetical protein
MKTHNKYFLLAGLCLAIMGVMALCSLNKSTPEIKYKQDRANFKNGEVILPDYAHSDTLIVTDGKGLNEAIEKIDGTDGEIDSVLRLFCVPY